MSSWPLADCWTRSHLLILKNMVKTSYRSKFFTLRVDLREKRGKIKIAKSCFRGKCTRSPYQSLYFRVKLPGSGSDYAPFRDRIGIPCVDIRYTFDKVSKVLIMLDERWSLCNMYLKTSYCSYARPAKPV